MIRCWLALLLLAQATAPTTTSSTRPVAVDLSTPAAAAKTLFRSVAAGDRDALRATLDANDPSQRELVAAMADLIVNGQRLGEAARQQFGAAGDPIGRGMFDPADLSRLDKATVNETGATATINIPDSGRTRPMAFRRRGGQWRLIVTDYAAAAPANVTHQTRLVRLMADAMEESARDLAAGKYKTPDAAVNGIQRKLHEVMLTITRPATTRATTGPATEPSPQK